MHFPAQYACQNAYRPASPDGPNLAEIGPDWPKLIEFGPILVDSKPSLTESGQLLVEAVGFRTQIGQNMASFGRTGAESWAKARLRNRAECGRSLAESGRSSSSASFRAKRIGRCGSQLSQESVGTCGPSSAGFGRSRPPHVGRVRHTPLRQSLGKVRANNTGAEHFREVALASASPTSFGAATKLPNNCSSILVANASRTAACAACGRVQTPLAKARAEPAPACHEADGNATQLRKETPHRTAAKPQRRRPASGNKAMLSC